MLSCQNETGTYPVLGQGGALEEALHVSLVRAVCGVLISSTPRLSYTGCDRAWGMRSPAAQVAWELLLVQDTISCAVWHARGAWRRESPATGQARR